MATLNGQLLDEEWRSCYALADRQRRDGELIHVRKVNPHYPAMTHCGLQVRNDLPFLSLFSWVTGTDYSDLWCPSCRKRVVRFFN